MPRLRVVRSYDINLGYYVTSLNYICIHLTGWHIEAFPAYYPEIGSEIIKHFPEMREYVYFIATFLFCLGFNLCNSSM